MSQSAIAKFFHRKPKPPTAAEQARARVRELTAAITECRQPEPLASVIGPRMSASDLEQELDPRKTPGTR